MESICMYKALFLMLVLTRCLVVYHAQGCGNAVYKETSGTITSPNHPQLYNNNINCTYSIRTSQPSSFTLSFQRFSLENSDPCTYDWVQIRCDDNSYVTRKYCGLLIPTAVLINNCNRVLIWFQTDVSGTDSGFSLQYIVTGSACRTTEYSSSAGYVSSPGFPNAYAHDLDCSHNLRSSGHTSLTISFLTIDFEVADGCRYDFVEIWCSNNYESIKKICRLGETRSIFYASCNNSVIRFRTDGSNSGSGFNFYYTFQRAFSTPPTTRMLTTTPTRTTYLPTTEGSTISSTVTDVSDTTDILINIATEFASSSLTILVLAVLLVISIAVIVAIVLGFTACRKTKREIVSDIPLSNQLPEEADSSPAENIYPAGPEYEYVDIQNASETSTGDYVTAGSAPKDHYCTLIHDDKVSCNYETINIPVNPDDT